MDAVRAVDGRVQLLVRAHPGAKRTETIGIVAGQLRIRLAAPAVDGKANAELIRFLAQRLGVRRSAIDVRRGATSRIKLVAIDGVTVDECIAALLGR